MIQGRGFFIWQIPNCEKGNPDAIAAAAQAAGLSWVAVKIADGGSISNRPYINGRFTDLVGPLVASLREPKNPDGSPYPIQVWGWQFVYGFDPLGEAATATDQLRKFELDGYIIDAEADYKLPGRGAIATGFMNQMRRAFPDLPMALCSYRFPKLHPEFPWDEFLAQVDLNMPQVYWEQAHNPTAQLAQSLEEFGELPNKHPMIPVGPTYKVDGWAPTPADLQAFQAEAARCGMPGTGYFSWDECRRDLPALWDEIAGHPSQPEPAPVPAPEPAPKPEPEPKPAAQQYLVTIGPRWVYTNAELTGRATGRVNRGARVTIMETQGHSGRLDKGGWIDISSGVKVIP